MNRRAFSRGLAGAFAVSLSPLAGAQPSPSAARAAPAAARVSPRARALYHAALILDCNSGPPEGRLPLAQADLEAVRGSGIDVVKYSLGGINDDFATTVAAIAQVQRLIEAYPAYFTQVRAASDFARAKADGKLGIILSFESAEMLQGRLESFELFRNFGVRVMQLSYNRKSPFAAGVMEPDGGGLTPLGRQAVAEMNRLGIAIDVSHANAATTTDVLDLSSKPPLMTHAGCAAIHAHPRNKTDEQLRALADRGGVVGIFDLPYLTASPRQPTVDDYLAHLEHALMVAGESHVGIGSDTDILPMDVSEKGMAQINKQLEQRRTAGLAASEEDRPPYVVGLNTPRRIEIIVDRLLKRGYPAAVVEKVAGANCARVLADIWSSPSDHS
ncbi:MAG TPA: membrane dipeptidase [Steroidobacteraceae bacterium]|nr:membrane dipeptidase [Steroidobacteraceae bacterium]